MGYPDYCSGFLTNYLSWSIPSPFFQHIGGNAFYPNTCTVVHRPMYVVYLVTVARGARRRAWLLSARAKAARASVRSSKCFWNFSLDSSAPWHDKWAVVSSSEVMDAGNFEARPKTACSGLKPSMIDMVFLARKHWVNASSNCWVSSMDCSLSILSSMSLTVAPWRSIRPLCQGAADKIGWMPFSSKRSFQWSVMNSPPWSWAICCGYPAQLNQIWWRALMVVWMSLEVRKPRWNRVASSKTWMT